MKQRLASSEWFPGHVKAIRPGGLFDVVFDDGTKQEKVPRYRLRRDGEPPWQLLYVGKGCSYEAQGLLPDYVLEGEPDAQASVRFTVQTIGTEYGWDKRTRTVVSSDERSLMTFGSEVETTGLAPELTLGKFGSSTVQRKLKEAV